MGGTVEAFKTAVSVREYLDSINHHKTKVILFDTAKTEVNCMLGHVAYKKINKYMKDMRISVLCNSKLKELKGDHKIEEIVFRKDGEYGDLKDFSEEYYDYSIKPDVVIAENGMGKPTIDLNALIENKEHGSEDKVSISAETGLPISNIRF